MEPKVKGTAAATKLCNKKHKIYLIMSLIIFSLHINNASDFKKPKLNERSAQLDVKFVIDFLKFQLYDFKAN